MAATEESAPDDLGIGYLRDATFIGRGGFARVYAATDTRFDRRVAVKVFDHLLTDDDRALFEAECRTTGRLSGIPNIITIHDTEFTADGRACIVMALIPGGSLGDELRRQGLIGWRRATGHMVTILRALAEAHGRGVLHRDVKPENILIEDGRVYLTDFGLATLAHSTDPDVGHADVIASPLHTAPETFGGVRDERSDVYSAGSTLYNLIAGHAPFQRHADLSTEAIVERLRTQPVPPLPAGLAPPELDALIRRSLAKDPGERPQTATEMAEVLQSVIDAHTLPTQQAPSAGRAPDAGRRPAPTAAGPGAASPVPPSTAVPVPAAPVPGGSGPPPASSPPLSGAANRTRPRMGLAPPRWGSRSPAPPAPAVAPRSPAATTGSSRGWPRWLRLDVAAVTTVVGAAVVLLTVANWGARDTSGPGRRLSSVTVATDGPARLSRVAPIPDAEARWTVDREVVVAEIIANGWGWDQEAGQVRGPGGLLVDLGSCPSGWDPFEGVGTGNIRLGQSVAVGADAEVMDNAAGFEAYFRWVNAHGGLGLGAGPATNAAVDAVTPPGSGQPEAGVLAVRALTTPGDTGELNAACVPNPFVPADAPGWTDPEGSPWLWSDGLSATTQGHLLGEIVVRSLPSVLKIDVAALVTTDDFGLAAEHGLRAFLSRWPEPVELDVTTVGVAVGDVTRQLADLSAGDYDVVLLVTGSPAACTAYFDQGIDLVAPLVATTSACAADAPAADRRSELLAVGSPRRTSKPRSFEDDPWLSWSEDVLRAAGHGAPQTAAMLEGFASAWSLHQALLIADRLPGGLSRPNLLLAARAMHLDNPSLADGVGYGMHGALDGDLIEGALIVRYNGFGGWEPSDLGVIDASGHTPPCPWDQERRACG